MSSDGWAFLGELNKILPVSKTRFVDIIIADGDIHAIFLSGVPGEQVPLTVYDAVTGSSEVHTCTMSPAGTSFFLFPHGPCVDK